MRKMKISSKGRDHDSCPKYGITDKQNRIIAGLIMWVKFGHCQNLRDSGLPRMVLEDTI